MVKNSVNDSAGKYSLADALFTTAQQRILGLLFGQPDRSFYLSEIVRFADIGRGAVQRELNRLEQTGIVTSTHIGNQKHFQANPNSPLFKELSAIVKKTVGLNQPLVNALKPISEKIIYAFVYGSIANGTDTARSDIDLMVVSDELILEDLFLVLSPLQSELGREVNPTLYKSSEFSAKSKIRKGFLGKVLSSPIIELVGSIDG